MTPQRTEIDGGFTLVEVLAALVMAALALWIVLPSWVGSNQARRLQDATSAVVATLDQSRARAMTTGKTVHFAIDPGARTFGPVDGGTRRLAAGVDFHPQTDALGIAFRPDGTADGSTLYLRNGTGQARIDVNWLTGRPSVKIER